MLAVWATTVQGNKQIDRMGRPLTGNALLGSFADDVPVEARRTDPSGASFPLTPGGTWLLNAVWTKPVSAPSEVDFDTTFSSLTFGFP